MAENQEDSFWDKLKWWPFDVPHDSEGNAYSGWVARAADEVPEAAGKLARGTVVALLPVIVIAIVGLIIYKKAVKT